MSGSKNTPQLPAVTDIHDLAGTYVLLRASLNVPIENGVVQNQFRIARALATIEYLVAHGARVIIVAHIGRDETDTLAPVYDVLKESVSLSWCPETIGEDVRTMRDALSDGDVLLLENLRAHPGERKNDPTFAQELADLADIYVNDAFAASHRAHASLVGVPQHLPSYFGCNFIREYQTLADAREPLQPALFILGGAKFETKIPLIPTYLSMYDHVFVGGALAHDIWKTKGYHIGRSLTSDIDLTEASFIDAENLLLPVDVTVQSPSYTRVTTPDEIGEDEMILDAGPQTVEMLASYTASARTILWNGPLGDYEKGFATTTEQLADRIARAPGRSIVGGGDTIASIAERCLENRFGFLSTAGGAMLTFLAEGTLPAIDAVAGP